MDMGICSHINCKVNARIVTMGYLSINVDVLHVRLYCCYNRQHNICHPCTDLGFHANIFVSCLSGE